MIRVLMCLLTILALVASDVLARGGTVTGAVTSKDNGEAVPFASVQIEGSSIGAMADSAGVFTIRNVPSGKHRLVFTSVSFHGTVKTVNVDDGGVSECNAALTPASVDAGSIVVTGTRTPRYISNTPILTEVVTRASIEDKAAHNVFEALDGETGVRVEQQCQACNFSILRMQGLGADHTQVLLDGQPVYSGLASVYGLQQMSVAEIDRIEIVKGAGSALYGANAVAGAINLISTVPRKTEGRVGLEIGEFGTNEYSVSASARHDNLGVFLFAQQNKQDGIDATGDVGAPDGVDESDGVLDRVWSDSRNIGFNVFVDDVISSDQLIVRGRFLDEQRRGGVLTGNLYQNPYAAGSEFITTDRSSAIFEYRTRLFRATELNSSLSYIHHERNATNDTFLGDYETAKGEVPPVDLMRPYVADEKLWIANLSVVQPMLGSHRLLTGLQLSRNSLQESGMYLDTDTEVPYVSTSNKKSHEAGVYVQDEYSPCDELEFVAGLRCDYHNSEDEFRGSGDVLPLGLEPLKYEETTVTPRVSVKYAATEALVVRGSVGSGFRVPYGFSEDLHLCSGSPRVYKSGDLKPEKSLSYSVSADYTLSSLSVSVNLFRTDLRDAIAFADADETAARLGYTYQWKNVDDAYVMGAEFNASVSPHRHVSVGTRFELFDGKYDHPRADWVGTPYEQMSRHIPRYPGWSGGVKLEVTPGDWDFVVDTDIKGKMYIDLAEPEDEADVQIHETETFALFNAKVGCTLFDRYDVYIGARNLTDYTQEVKHISDAAFMYAPTYGRIFYGGVQMSF